MHDGQSQLLHVRDALLRIDLGACWVFCKKNIAAYLTCIYLFDFQGYTLYDLLILVPGIQSSRDQSLPDRHKNIDQKVDRIDQLDYQTHYSHKGYTR